MTALCEITTCVVCQEWEGRRRSVHGTSITPLIPPLAGYRGEDCSSSVNQCVSNPCDPEGTLLCEELANTSRCVCQHGYTGRRCATPISRCVDGPCQHGSACVGLPGGFRCDCLPGRRAIQRGVICFFFFLLLLFFKIPNEDDSSNESCTRQTLSQFDVSPCSASFFAGV